MVDEELEIILKEFQQFRTYHLDLINSNNKNLSIEIEKNNQLSLKNKLMEDKLEKY